MYSIIYIYTHQAFSKTCLYYICPPPDAAVDEDGNAVPHHSLDGRQHVQRRRSKVQLSACYITLHYITLHYITLHYITLHYITLHYITLHYITLHYITLHYITPLHCISLLIHCIIDVIQLQTLHPVISYKVKSQHKVIAHHAVR